MDVYHIIRAVDTFMRAYSMLVVVYCISTWFPFGRGGILDDVRSALATLVEPYLGIFRKYIPALAGIDFSPIIALLVLELLERALIAILVNVFV